MNTHATLGKVTRRYCAKCGAELPGDGTQKLCVRCSDPLPAVEEPPPQPSQPQTAPTATGGPDAPAPGRPQSFGDYELLQEIARGGMGVVFCARQISLNRIVALKMILAGQLAGDDQVKRFRTEAEAAASLDHPNIVPIYEVGEHNGQHFFSMRLIEGRSLAEISDQFPDDPRAAARLIATVAHAVHYAHQRGILHRDLKPANILIDAQGQPHVTDFGLAKRVGSDSSLTRTSVVVGTINYMAPEQALAETRQLTTAVDIHSLGAILYHLLTGRAPFDSDNPLATMRMLVEQEPVRPSQAGPLRDRDLETICLRCLEKDPARRYGSADALADDLERWLRHEPILARRSSTVWRLAKWVRRKPALAGTLALLHVVAFLGLAGILLQWQRAERAERTTLEKLRDSYLAQAQARRFSGQPGRRFASLEVLAKAAAIRPSLELRNETIACLPLVDLNLARRWEFKLNKELASFDVAIQRYAVGDEAGGITVRRVSDDVEVMRLPAPAGAGGTPEIAFSPDGRFLRAVYPRARIWAWDLNTRQTVLSARGDNAEFAPGSRQLAVSEAAGGLGLYDLATGRKLRSLGGDRQFQRLGFDHGGQQLAAIGLPTRKDIFVFDVESGAELARLEHTHGVPGFAWHPQGRYLASCEYSQSAISIWDLETKTNLRQFDEAQTAPVSLEFSQDGALLLSGGWDGKVRLWDFQTGRHSLIANGGGFVQVSPDNQRVGVVSWARDALWCYETAQARELLVIREDRTPSEGGERVTFNRDGTLLAYTIGGHLKLCDPLTGREWASIAKPTIDNVLAHPSDNGFCLAGERRWYRWPVDLSARGELRMGPLRPVGPTGDYWWGVNSSDGKVILAQHGQDHAHFLDGETFAERAKTKTTHPGMRFHALSADGRWAASGAWHNPTVKIWDTLTGEEERVIETEDMCSVAFSPDDRWLVIGGKDYQFLELDTWVVKRKLERPPMERFPPAMAFSRDGRILALCDTWQSVKLIRMDDGRELATLEAPNPWNISQMSFNSDASLLAVAGSAPEIQVWNLRLIRQQLAPMNLDWEMPPYPPPTPPPARVEVRSGDAVE